MNYAEIIQELKASANSKNAEGMARYGICAPHALGISIPALRKLARRIGKNHELALRLWGSDIHEARILAAYVDEPALVSEAQMEEWAKDFDSWDVVDQVCSNLFDRTGFAYQKALEWSGREEEFVKRAGFVMMATLAVHDKKADDRAFLKFLPIIKRESGDGRNFVKKAVNWALRQIGKRNLNLNKAAIKTAQEIRETGLKAARWIAADALRELSDEKVRERIKKLRDED